MKLSPQGIQNLNNHKYPGEVTCAVTDRMFLQRWWKYAVNLLPYWLSANVVTTLGSVSIWTAVILMQFYDYTYTKELPSWVYFYGAACLFIYQTLDAIDGKQARRTNSVSPLGELFDHGMDALTMSSVYAIFELHIFKLGSCYFGIFLVLLYSTNFFIVIWENAHGYLLRSAQYGFGISEGQLVHIALLILAGFFGTDIYKFDVLTLLPPILVEYIPFQTIEITYCVLIVAPASMGLISAFSLLNIFKKSENRCESFSILLPLPLLIGLAFLFGKTDVFMTCPALPLFAIIFGYSISIMKLIICNMAGMKHPIFNKELFIYALPVINSFIYPSLSSYFTGNPEEYFMKESLTFIICIIFLAGNSFLIFFHVVYQISANLGMTWYLINKPSTK